MSHTPGPWVAIDDAIIAHDGDFEVAAVPLRDDTNPTEWQANMRLIAASPDLLEALKSLRADVVGALGIGVSDSIGHTNAAVLGHKCQVAYEAIAKAEGR